METEIILNIFISVFAGVLTSALIYVGVLFFNRVIVPWYQSKVYRGLDISGEWTENHNYKDLITQESK
jgi:hypothetical protein